MVLVVLRRPCTDWHGQQAPRYYYRPTTATVLCSVHTGAPAGDHITVAVLRTEDACKYYYWS